MNRLLRHGAVLAIACAALNAWASGTSQCVRTPLARWDIALAANLPVTQGSVNGKPVGVLIDTGSAASLLTAQAARRLGLVARSSPERMRGIGGDSVLRTTRITELRIGAWSERAMAMHVVGDLAIPGVDLVLGEDVLHALDVEFEYARHTVRIFEPATCGDAWLADWDPLAQAVAIDGDDRAVRLAIALNGIPADAMLDSGAVRTLVSLDFAYRAGLAPDAPGVQPAGCAVGLGGEVVREWTGPFGSFQVGRETLRDARLAFADFTVSPDAPLLRAPALSYTRRSPDVLLGNDFLRAHRVLVARGQGRIYFSRVANVVFADAPAGECGGPRSSRGSPDR